MNYQWIVLLIILVLFFPFVLISFVVAAIRGDNDDRGNRAKALFYGAIAFFTSVVALSALFGFVKAIINATHLSDYGNCNELMTQGSVSNSASCPNNQTWQLLVISAIIFLIAGVVFIWNRARVKELKAESGYAGSAAERSIKASSYLIVFVAVLTIVSAKISAAYDIFRIFGPGVFGGTRADTVRSLILMVVLAFEGWGLMWLFKDETGVFFRLPMKKAAAPTE